MHIFPSQTCKESIAAYKSRKLGRKNCNKNPFSVFFSGAASLVWFIYLPLMAVVAWQISALWRTKFIIGVTYTADTFAYGVLMHLLWPSRKEQYFLLAAPV